MKKDVFLCVCIIKLLFIINIFYYFNASTSKTFSAGYTLEGKDAVERTTGFPDIHLDETTGVYYAIRQVYHVETPIGYHRRFPDLVKFLLQVSLRIVF